MCVLCQTFTGTPDIGEKMLYAAYIDPGAGFVFSSTIPMILGTLATLFFSVILFLRKRTVPFIKKHKVFFLLILVLFIIGTIIFVLKQTIMNKSSARVIIIGLDGLDPKIVDQEFKKGHLPNLMKLKRNGTYSQLQTTMPAQSPVAWASFITGNWPAKHGVFDFIERDPKTYLADLVFSDPKKNPIHSATFWEIASQNNIPITSLFLPDTFPASAFRGKMISGMGTPDILGTEGSLTLFSSKNYPLDPKWRGRLVRLGYEDDSFATLEGPKFTTLNQKKVTSIPLEIKKNKKNKTVTISIQNQTITLKEKNFSQWTHLEFSVDFFTKIRAIAKFYLKSSDPLELYLSPMNFDPQRPVFPISNPKNYVKDLSREYGVFSTLGLPNDTWALEENIFDEDAFLQQVDSVQSERKKIILGELKKFKKGIFFGYFGITDTIQHMFWRDMNNPSSKYQGTIFSYYRKVDEIVGEIMKSLNNNDVLIVLSDHGFDGYDYEMNVNSWLMQNGYLNLKHGDDIGKPLFENVDWSKTKAYALGYNGIFINLKGREGKGIVSNKEANRLEKEISSKLIQLTNPETGEKIFKKIYSKKDLEISQNNTSSPDLSLGYYKGVRGSWDTAVGAGPKEIVVKRRSKWSGDHLFDPSEVPGILFINRKFEPHKPRIVDIIPTALGFFNISDSVHFDGNNLVPRLGNHR